ncbi:hypothetical protein D9615_006858 [Tricholomella constricta]|uniref:Reverse transcriptase domain-containing protein n=1 Tax=Tricholomella constricta TaxID=117010 RepID=A0A8H5H8X4_9AGAR|nr:hypothetical protein D9615_006858 [Tricholomella constricta]
MSCPEFRSTLELYDINLFQETHLRPNQHDTISLPPHYSILSRTRRPKDDFRKSWGGVAAVFSERLPLQHRNDLSGPDFMVLQMGRTLIYNVYLLPESATWTQDLESDPCEALAASLALASMAEFHIILMGDLNARTASLIAYPLDPPRLSKDNTVSTRGRWLCRTLADNDMAIVNGIAKFGDNGGDYTSFQGTRRTVIDYAAVSNVMWASVTSFSVCTREDGYDHAALTLDITLDITRRLVHTPSRKSITRNPLPTTTELDRLLITTLEAGKDVMKRNLALYGPIYTSTNPTKVSVHGICTNSGKATATAGIGLYWGLNSPRNIALRIRGSNLTSTHAEIAAIAQALQIAPKNKSLEVSTHSEYAVKALTVHAQESAARGWRVTNGEILQQTMTLVKSRWAPLHLLHVKKPAQSSHLKEACVLAKRGATGTPDAPLPPLPDTPPPAEKTPLPLDKVTSNITQHPANPHNPHPDTVPKRPDFPEAHRGRNKLLAIKDFNRRQVMEAPNNGVFWKIIKRLADPQRVQVSVSAHELKSVFEARLNPPPILPPSFDSNQYQLNRILANLIPPSTTDQTPEKFFSSQWEEDDIAWVKDHLKKHSISSTPGEDNICYSAVMSIPNDDLVLLCNECIRLRDAPSIWCKSVVVGVLKKNNPAADPNSYRVVALESCVLKIVMLLIHKRITDWAESNQYIPQSQNGFRANRRTNDNPFILRCAWEQARANKEPLFVAAIDATNAFPSTDHPSLWLKLSRLGMGGPLFDWLRIIYEKMEYYVRHGTEESPLFKALIGLLTGDPASPVLWNLYMADLTMPPDIDDVHLAGNRISMMAQADDILIISRTADGLKRKLMVLETWCGRNFIIINLIKTVILIFGTLRPPIPIFRLAGALLSIKPMEKYVGILISTDTNNPFEEHYTSKAGTARYCGHRIMATEDLTGRLTPKELKQLYMARVDCHLIHGCEISPDAEEVHVSKLEDVQISFLRRILNVHKRSMLVPLYTETGIMPLRPRRLLLTLRFLRYLVSLNNDRYAHIAFRASLELASRNKKSWAGDLKKALLKLPFRTDPIDLESATVQSTKEYIDKIENEVSTWLQGVINTSDKLYLLRDRKEQRKDEAPKQITLHLRHYLSLVKTRAHREAITSVMLSTHMLAVEKLRWVEHGHPRVNREERLCRLCRASVETPEHALLDCTASPELLALRHNFLLQFLADIPHLQSAVEQMTSTDLLKRLIAQRPTISLVAKFAYQVLKLYYDIPIYRAPPSVSDS